MPQMLVEVQCPVMTNVTVDMCLHLAQWLNIHSVPPRLLPDRSRELGHVHGLGHSHLTGETRACCGVAQQALAKHKPHDQQAEVPMRRACPSLPGCLCLNPLENWLTSAITWHCHTVEQCQSPAAGGRPEPVGGRAGPTSSHQLQRLLGKGGKGRSSPEHKFEPVCTSTVASVHTLYQQAHSCKDLAGVAKLPGR